MLAPQSLLASGLLAVAYFVVGRLVLATAPAPGVTVLWAPTGLALAAVLLLGQRVWPGILAGAFLVTTTTTGTVAASLAVAAGHTFEAVFGAYLVSSLAGGHHAFERGRNVVKFVLLAGLLSTAASATVGVAALRLAGLVPPDRGGLAWATWWLGAAAGAMVITPVLVLWAAHPRVRWTRRQALEAALLALSVVVAGHVVFGPWLPTGVRNYPLSYLCIPSLVWAAFRFGSRETATATLLLSAIAAWGTARGSGPFADETLAVSVLLLQVFLGATAVLALGFAAVIATRKRLEEERERALAQVKVLRGLLPICASCKRIRNDQGYWEGIETYIMEHSEADFTHGLCPECAKRLYPQFSLEGDTGEQESRPA